MKYVKRFENFQGDNYTLTVKSKGEEDLPDGPTIEPGNYKKISTDNLIYNGLWKHNLPEVITILYKDKELSFKKGNVMLLGDLVEVTYESITEIWGEPDCLEFDFYFTKDNLTNNLRVNIDITYGDLMACEFSIEKLNKVNLIQHTTYHSKFDTSNTVFALDDKSLDDFINFLNKFPGFKVSRNDLRFLDKYDNWKDN